MSPPLPASVQGVFIASLIGSVLLGCCAAYGVVGLVAQNMMMGALEDSGAGLDAGLGGEFGGTFEMMRIVTIASLVLQLCSTGVLVGVGALGLSRHPLGRALGLAGFASFGLLSMFEAVLGVVAWHRMQSLFQLSDGVGDGSEIASAVGALQLAPTGCWLLAKGALAAAGIGVLLSNEATSYYQRISGRSE